MIVESICGKSQLMNFYSVFLKALSTNKKHHFSFQVHIKLRYTWNLTESGRERTSLKCNPVTWRWTDRITKYKRQASICTISILYEQLSWKILKRILIWKKKTCVHELYFHMEIIQFCVAFQCSIWNKRTFLFGIKLNNMLFPSHLKHGWGGKENVRRGLMHICKHDGRWPSLQKHATKRYYCGTHYTHTHTTVRKTNFIQYKNDMQFYIYTYNMYIEVMYEKEKPVLFMYFDLYVQE